jgi:HAD superfamily hydrolase (TIGR01662 family)
MAALPVRAVLFDRDGTLVADVPYLNDPAKVEPVPQARAALDRLRRAEIFVGVLTNQPGIAEGLVTWAQLTAVNQRIEDLLGPFDVWGVCPHARGCACRMPKPGLVRQATRALAVRAGECVIVGGARLVMQAARNAGARPILIPTSATTPLDTEGEDVVASLGALVDHVMQ